MQEQDPTPEEDTPIAEMFARDPFKHTTQSLDAIIKTLREQRHRFKAGDKSAGSPKPKSKTALKQEEAMKIGGDLLDGLDL